MANTASSTLGVVLSGCGAVTENYYGPALAYLERAGEVRVAGIFDPDEKRTSRAVSCYFPQATACNTFRSLLQCQAQLAIVASPPQWHAEQTIAAIEAGFHVLCEKPLAIDVVEAEEMMLAAERGNRLVAIGLIRRHLPAAAAIRNFIGAGLLGEIRAGYCFEGGPFDWPISSCSYFRKDVSGGGVMQDVGTHCLDLLCWWLGRPKSILYEDDQLGGIEANCRAICNFDGFDVTVRLSRDWHQPNHYTLNGTRGWLRWPVNSASEFTFALNESNQACSIVVHSQGGAGRAGSSAVLDYNLSFVNQIRDVANAIRNGSVLLAPGRAGLEVLKLVQECYSTRTEMAMPWMFSRGV